MSLPQGAVDAFFVGRPDAELAPELVERGDPADERERDEHPPRGLRQSLAGGGEPERRAKEERCDAEAHERSREGPQRHRRREALVGVVECPEQVHDPPRGDAHE